MPSFSDVSRPLEVSSATLIGYPIRPSATPNRTVTDGTAVKRIEFAGRLAVETEDLDVQEIDMSGAPSEIEIIWPSAMLYNLKSFFDMYLRQRSFQKYNCHTFGAYMIGQMDLARFSLLSHEPTNSNRYNQHDPVFMAFGALYGVFDNRRPKTRPSHSMLATHDLFDTLSIGGYQGYLVHAPRSQMQSAYGGELQAYDYLASTTETNMWRIQYQAAAIAGLTEFIRNRR